MRQEKGGSNAVVVDQRLCRISMMSFSILAVIVMVWGVVSAAPAQTGKQADMKTDFERLEGRWVRPDGGYVLELAEVKKDGGLKASYFNPRPINVSKATWSRKEGILNLFVELRDVNYPGSTYTLQYDAKSDRLRGTYFQAVEKQTFNIEFARAK